MSKVSIRLATKEDISRIVEMIFEWTSQEWGWENFSHMNTADTVTNCIEKGFVFVACTKEDKIVGLVSGIFSSHPICDKKIAYETGFFVVKEHRNGRVAKLLLDAFEKRAKDFGADEMMMCAMDSKAYYYMTRKGYKAFEAVLVKKVQ